ncbi:hypothetical protein KAW18_18420, partial [candidate division WOR-3 bacterium]|nr:hypothetical protein [candidate division WOR-3 bacterium]
MHRFLVVLSLGIIVFSLGLFGEVIEFEDSWGPDGVRLLSQSPNEVVVNFSISNLRFDEILIDNKEMTQVSIPGVILPNDEGAPNLPGIGRWIAIPEGATPELEIVSSREEVYKGIKIAPAPNIPFEVEGSHIIYKKNPLIYNADEYYPGEPVRLSEKRSMRGVDAVILGITPFQYNPVTEELIVYRDIKVRVTWNGGNLHFGEERLRSRFWEPVLHSNLINYSSLPEIDFNDPSRYRGDGYEYVIIIPDDPDFIAWADTIKNWRTLRGIKTGVVKLSEIGGNTVNAIETFVDTAYNNWTVPPVAVLLLSDYQGSGKAFGITSLSMPHPYSGTYVSDNIYADVDGIDSLPEICFARITAQDAFNLDTMITKFLDFERNPPTSFNFYDEPLVACGFQTTRWFQLCSEIVRGFWLNELGKNPQRQYNIYSGSPSPGDPWSSNSNTYMVVDYFGESGLGYISDTIPPGIPWDSGSASGINNAIDNGTFIVQHRDHGGEDGWGEPDYTIPDLAGLSNDMLPFVFSINCLTGRYDYGTEVFTERFHRMSGGALGVIAASQVSYSFVNDTYIFGLYDNLWHNFDPAYPESTMWGYEHLRPGFASCSGKYYLESSNWPYNPDKKDLTFNLFHMHGDPFITLNSEVPESLNVTYLPVIPIGGQPFTVTVVEKSSSNPVDSARVAIWCSIEDSVWLRGWTDGTGTITFDPHPMILGDTMWVTVTKSNYFMHRGFSRIVSGVQV